MNNIIKTCILFLLFINCAFSQWNTNSIDTITRDHLADFNPNASQLMAVDNTNSLHIVWQKRESPNTYDGTRTYYCKKINNSYWIDPIAISDTLKSSWSPGIVVNKYTGKVYITYYSFFFNGTKQISDIILETDESGIWEKISLTSGISNEVTPTIAIDNNLKIHIAWVGLDSLGNWKIKYCNNLTGNWNIQTLFDSQLGAFGTGAYPNISLEKNGKAHIFYRGDTGYREIHHVENNLFGGTEWTYEQITNFNWYSCYALSQISNNGDIHLVTTGSSDFQAKSISYHFIRENNSTNWSMPKLITNGDGAVNSFVLDINNKAHISWTETSSWFSTGNVYYANNKNSDWIFYQVPVETLYNGANLIIDNNNFGHIIYAKGFYPDTNYEIYHVESINDIVNINAGNNFIPSTIILYQNFPNPFNNQTVIKFDLKMRSNMKLALYNIFGMEVLLIEKGFKEAGIYEYIINASSLASGIYFCRLENSKYSDTKKLLLIK